MRITTSQVAKLMLKLEHDQEKLKRLLKHYFSYECNIDTFSKFIFPQYILGDIPDFHREFYEFLLSPDDEGLAAPRGHAKSTVCGLVFPAWCYIYKKKKYIVYISQNFSKATQFIEPHRTEPKENVRMRWLYGNLISKKVIGENGKDRTDCIDINGCRIQALSFENNIRGIKFKNMRPDLIIGDDIEDDKRVKNPTLRFDDMEKLNKAILPSLDIVCGVFKMIGTVLHLDSLLSNKIKEYKGKIYRAEEEDGKLLWPEYFTRKRLDKKKKSIGTVAYQQEYLNNPVDNSTSVIKSEWVRQCFDYGYDETVETLERLYLGVDFAFSDRVAADSSVFMDVGIKDNKKIPHKIRWRKGMSINEQLTLTKSLYESMKYYSIAFEENSIKGSVKDIRGLNMPIKMFWTGSRDSPTFNKEKKPNESSSYSKTNAVNRLAVEFENEMWRIPYNTDQQKIDGEKLLSELCSWALEDGKLVELGKHPDAPICMLLVNETLAKPKVICV